MPPPVLVVGGEEEAQSNLTLLASSASIESVCQNGSELKERNYMGLSDCSSVDSSAVSTSLKSTNLRLNLKATELRLGLPGTQSPERNPELSLLSSPKLDEKPLFPLFSPKSVVSGSKRGFSDTVEEKILSSSEVNVVLSPRPASNLSVKSATAMDTHSAIKERPRVTNESNQNRSTAVNNSNIAPAAKAQVVGWPPIRPSFRKNSLAAITSKNPDEVDRKAGTGALFVKVSMDGAPYLRKVDLRTYSVYQELSSALEKMFSCFTIGKYGSHGPLGKEKLSESKLKDLLHGSEYVLTYEDKDGDWMLVGDVPWEMFINTCKRLRIMKSSDAIGLAPRAMEKSCNRN